MTAVELEVTHPDGATEKRILRNADITIGRGEDNTIVLPSKHASRYHARVWMEGTTAHFQDLDSRNGVELNGERHTGGPLHDGDSLRIGGSVIVVRETADSGFGRSVISREDARAVHESILQDSTDKRLLLLYQAAKLLGEVFDLDELLNHTLALIFRALPVTRGYILTRAHATATPEIRAAHPPAGSDSGPPISETLVQHVFDNAEAILTMDAQEDSRFGQAESIMGHDIHAAMCAPLHGRAAVAGVIYVDVGDTATPLTDADLELLSAIAQVVGVAVENARLYQENVERERLAAIGMATAGLGHCIKNILTGIRGGAQFVTMAIEKQDLKYLGRSWPILRRAIERIDMLAVNMLVFSKDRKPERVRTDINALIRDVLGVIEERAARYNVQIHFDPDPAGMAHVDPQGIYRVLLNLVVNAVEACEHNEGAISIACSCDDQGCTIRVHDTGIGIPEDIVPQLSQVFVSSKGSSGTGLGLACSYKIVREHGGDIHAESQSGSGTTFTVQLPAATETDRRTSQTALRRRPANDEK